MRPGVVAYVNLFDLFLFSAHILHSLVFGCPIFDSGAVVRDPAWVPKNSRTLHFVATNVSP